MLNIIPHEPPEGKQIFIGRPFAGGPFLAAGSAFAVKWFVQ